MRRRSVMALVLAAALAVGGVGEAAVVFAAESAETGMLGDEDTFEDVVQLWDGADAEDAELIPEEEPVEIFKEEAAENPEEDSAEDLFTASPQGEDLFSDQAPDELTDDVIFVGIQTVSAAYVTREQYEEWYKTGQEPDFEQIEGVVEGSLEEIITKLTGTNTGYCLIGCHENAEAYSNLVVPEGMTVGIMRWSPARIQSITPNGDVCLRADVETPGTLEINEGGGKVSFAEGVVNGEIAGSGSNDTVVFAGDWGQIGGYRGVENTIFVRPNLDIYDGYAEFYNITNLSESDRNISIFMQGYGEDRIPVFHKNFDFGKIQEGDEEWDAGIGVHYVENFDVPEGQDWKLIIPEDGSLVAKFEGLNDSDIISMADKMWLGGDNIGYRIDIDGTKFTENEENPVFHINRFIACEGLSEEQIYDRFATEELPESGWEEHIANTPKLDNVMRIINASGAGGYYFVEMPKNYKISGTLTVPEAATGVKYCSRVEETESGLKFYSPQVSSIDVPAGKRLGLVEWSGTGTLNITGGGLAEFFNCHFNKNITAADIRLYGGAVKSLNCDKLTAINSDFVVEEYLKFEEALLLNAAVLAKSGAYLNMGAINNEGRENDGFTVCSEVKGGKYADLYLGKAFDLGSFVDEDGNVLDGAFGVLYYSYEEAAKAGAECAQDIYNMNFNMWGEGTAESPHITEFLLTYEDTDRMLMSVSKEAAEGLGDKLNLLHFNFKDGIRLNPPMEATVTSGKCALEIMSFGEAEPTPSKAYIKIGATTGKELLTAAAVSAVKDQVYTGKNLTPSVTVKVGGKTLKNKTDYTLSYKNNKAIGKATVTITGKGNYTGTVKKTFNIIPKKGASYTVSGLKYKITKTASKNGTVTVTAPSKKTLTSVSVPATVKIKGYTFKVTAIADKAFKSNTKLKKVTLGANLTTIGKEAFYGCKSLKSIVINSKVLKSAGANSLKGIHSKAVIKVPSAKLTAYKKILKGKGQSSSVKISK
ncbi:leucine-rich repeat domain-containing protein [Blautia schinkii]|nr:leucine-rich repeat domain-containing protein [Blautia schinkii]